MNGPMTPPAPARASKCSFRAKAMLIGSVVLTVLVNLVACVARFPAPGG
jgi:hypothetical protein